MQLAPVVRSMRAIASALAAGGVGCRRRPGPGAHGSYEELIADPEIEAIYNPLPNHLHTPGGRCRRSSAGKHVLCEKPFSLTAAEAEQLREVAGRVHIMEAFMVRFHPQWQRVRELVRAGRIGNTARGAGVLLARRRRPAQHPQPGRHRRRRAVRHRLLRHRGRARPVRGRDPARVIALVDRDPALGTDRTTSALADFGSGRQLGFTVSTQAQRYQRLNIVGTSGRIEVLIPFNAPQGEATTILADTTGALDGSGRARDAASPATSTPCRSEAFYAPFAQKYAAYGLDDAVMNMRIIDGLLRSEHSGRWEAP